MHISTNFAWPLVVLALLFNALPAQAQFISRLIVEIRTGDVRFAGTDDLIQLQIGGETFQLDDPSSNEFERGELDRFEFFVTNPLFTVEFLRGAGALSVTKVGDSYFGGGWRFAGISILAVIPELGTGTVPLYSNAHVNKWLDSGDLEWSVSLNDPGWTLPEPRPFPPCFVQAEFEPVPTGVDSDCDGIPDGSDPNFDTPVDSDGDGLPDRYEDIIGTSSTNPDTDNDGWHDGRNLRSVLLLTQIRCEDEEEDVGNDEIYVVAEDVVYPEQDSLRGYWPLDDSSKVSPFLVVDSRVIPPGMPPVYTTRVRLREQDFEFFEKPTDDTYETFNVEWDEDGESTVEFNRSDYHYVLTFRWFTLPFSDSTPKINGDNDVDGLADDLEARISVQNSTVGQAVPGYNGLADPQRRNLFVEIDWSGSDARIQHDAKQMVVSRYHYQKIDARFDDGHLGGGTVVSHESIIDMDRLENHFKPMFFMNQLRGRHFRYVLFVDQLEDEILYSGGNGVARGANAIVSRTTMLGQFSAIVLIHELGHTMGLCHPDGTKPPIKPSPTCPTPANWPFPRCDHYCGVTGDDITAMGNDIVGDHILGTINAGIGGAAAGVVIGVLILSPLGPPGMIVGGILGGLVGGFVGAVISTDAYRRIVDYHPAEWAAIRIDIWP